MAEKARYPQIPSTVWWGVRGIFQKTPSATLDERYLSIHLGVQEAAARAYIVELKSVGILNEEGRATEITKRWRMDDKYPEAVSEIISTVYPESLRQVAPPGEADRTKIQMWFQHEGLGSGAAGNKAATYLLISSLTPNEGPSRSTSMKAPKEEQTSKRVLASIPRKQVRTSEQKQASRAHDGGGAGEQSFGAVPLNVNVQIHISADAGVDQIEAIFSSMRRYLYDKQGH